MKNMEQIVDEFVAEYASALTACSNQMAVGIGKDGATGEPTIEARLTNAKLKSIIPTTYQGLKVNVLVIGVISALLA